MEAFFLILARDGQYVNGKIEEMDSLKMPYLIVCGENTGKPGVIYRRPQGKYDAINFGFSLVPENTSIVLLNDVDTKIKNLESALRYFRDKRIALVFAGISVKRGPQRSFYRFLDSIRRRFLVTASGELMLIRYDLLKRMIPIKPCKAEDSYILYKALESGHKCVFCEECFVETERTKSDEKEEAYKRKTVCGIYQALAYTKPSPFIKVFYFILPLLSPLLFLTGRRGYYWAKGILHGLVDYLIGDKSGTWQATYKE